MRLPQGRGYGRGLESVISWARAVEKQHQRKLRTMGGRAPLGTPSQGLLLSPLPGCWRTEGFHDSFQRKMALHILSLEDFALSVTSATMVSSRLLTYHTVTLGCAPCVCVCACMHPVTRFCTQPCRSFPTMGLSAGPAPGSITSSIQ